MSSTFSITFALTTVPKEEKKQCEQRLEELKKYLADKYNIENVRDDSRLAWLHITMPQLHPLDDVCKEMWYMKLLYSYTDYPYLCKNYLPSIKHSLYLQSSWYPQSGQDAWSHTQNYVLPSIQLDCMVKSMKESGMLDNPLIIL